MGRPKSYYTKLFDFNIFLEYNFVFGILAISAGLTEGLLWSIATGGKYVKGAKAVNILIFILFFEYKFYMKNEVTYKPITTEIYRKIIEFDIIGIQFFQSSPHSFP